MYGVLRLVAMLGGAYKNGSNMLEFILGQGTGGNP